MATLVLFRGWTNWATNYFVAEEGGRSVMDWLSITYSLFVHIAHVFVCYVLIWLYFWIFGLSRCSWFLC